MKKKINLDTLKVKSFVTGVEEEGRLKGGASGYPCLSIMLKISVCWNECQEK